MKTQTADPSFDIRLIQPDETVAWFDALGTAFLERFDSAKIAQEVRPRWDYWRIWGAFEGDTVVGCWRSWATELTLPGSGRAPGSAVTTVGVRPTHRRRGILSRMAAADHAASRDRGETVALLYAAEYPIYGRFGYGPAVTHATWTLDPVGVRFHEAATGSVELVKPSFEVAESMRAVFDAWRLRQPGEISRREYTWQYDVGLLESGWGPTWKGFIALHRDAAGAVDGYVRYRAQEKWTKGQPRSVVELDELHALTDAAYLALWQFLANMDWVGSIKAERRSPAERLPWLLVNARAADVSGTGDGLWVKLIDVPGALAARGYEREGALVIESVEGRGTSGETRTRVALDANLAGATCKPTKRAADLTLDVAALSAAYLGGTRLRDAILANGGADEHRRGALAEADALFATLDPPWCSTFF